MSNKKTATRDGFGEGIVEAAKADERIVAACGDLTTSVKLDLFQNNFPNRFIQLGVAEQNLIGVSTGLALAGKIPFAASYAVFSPGNSWGVIRSSICYSNLNVKIVGGHAGLVTGPDGATHQALEDIAIMRVLPNMTVVVPADAHQAKQATIALAEFVGPAYLRIGKHLVTESTANHPFELGKAQMLKQGKDLTIITCGEMVEKSLATAQALEKQGKLVAVLNIHTIKPIDEQAIIMAAAHTKNILTVEDHQVAGGLGSAVLEVLAKHHQTANIQLMGVQDTFGESGQGDELLEKYGLGQEKIEKVILQLLS